MTQFIDPGQVAMFGSQDKGFMTGTIGSIRWSLADNETFLSVRWANPFIGTNAAGAWAFKVQ